MDAPQRIEAEIWTPKCVWVAYAPAADFSCQDDADNVRGWTPDDVMRRILVRYGPEASATLVADGVTIRYKSDGHVCRRLDPSPWDDELAGTCIMPGPELWPGTWPPKKWTHEEGQ